MDGKTVEEIFRENADWLRRNIGYWAPEIAQERFHNWVERTVKSLKEAKGIEKD